MKKPKLSDLKLDMEETKKIRSIMSENRPIKITINIDFDSLEKIKTLASETNVPYQRLLNNLLRESLDKKTTIESRVEKLEKEIKKLKKLIAA